MDSISEAESEKLLRQALKYLSTKYNIDIRLSARYNNNKKIYLYALTHYDTNVMVISPNSIEVIFTSISSLLHALLTAETILKISDFDVSYPNSKLSIDHDWVHIDFSKEFGTTIEELKIKLDLVNG